MTYEHFAQAWPGRDAGEFGEHLNSMPKYVASRTLTDATWNATIIEGDPAEAVARLKEEPGANLLKYGTGELDKALMAAGLVDEFHLWRIPVVVGAGDRIFDGFDQTHLKLVDTTSFGSGIAVQVFAPS